MTIVDLVSSARRLPPVPPDAASSFEAAGRALVGSVERTLADRADIGRLCGDLPWETVVADQQDHHAVMSMVLRFGAFPVLARTLPWIHRTHVARGCDPEYFRVCRTAFAWAIRHQLPQEHVGPILAVYAWMDTNHDVVQAIASRADPPPTLDPRRAAQHERFLGALFRGDVDSARALMAEQVGDGDGLTGFYLGVLDASMEEVGRRWELDEVSVADEHLATSVAARVMASTFVALPRRPAVRGRVLVTTAPGEQHVLGARVVADLLERDGWEVLFLGADTPVGEVVRFARRQRPVFLAVSVAIPTNVVAAADLVRAVRTDPALRGVRAMVGGQAFRRHPELVAKVGSDGYASDAAAAVDLARGWSTLAIPA